MRKKKQITLEGMKKAMAIELLPAKELKKQSEVPVDFSALMQKALKYDVKEKKICNIYNSMTDCSKDAVSSLALFLILLL